MTAETSNRIEQLICDSGLHPSYNEKTNSFIEYNFSEETILITGAAGSIGRELVNHLLHCRFKQLILIDNAETPLYFLIKDFDIQNNDTIYCLVRDVRDKDSMEWLFNTFKPTLIFHAAAYKHVSLAENNPYEAIKLNIFATKLIADLAIEHNTKRFIFISTDKAVDPISVMGMTKSIAEKYLDSLNSHHSTLFLTIRFGNIFGSNGSVIPLFIRQIKSGKPITITNNKATRYFIDNDKACNLILKVATISNLEGNKFAFNMDDPIKIIDLATKLIEIYNYKNQIEITDLKLGEKLHESLVSENEMLKPTNDKDIFVIQKKNLDYIQTFDISILYKIKPFESTSEIKDILTRFV